MKALLQRVCEASVSVDGRLVGAIERGLLVLLGMERGDGEEQARRLLRKILHYRLFADDAGRMSRSVADVGGGVLLVPQFTLSADTSKGLRPSFSAAMAPAAAEPLFRRACELLEASHGRVATGVFGAEMRVALVNDGPVTFLLRAAPGQPPAAHRRG